MKDRNFLDHYFLSVYNKLEADALLFNRKLPHSGMIGTENEMALANLLRDFLPPRFGIELSGIVIDHLGGESKQCDIIIYDANSFPKYFRKVFPIEIVYGVIEVKTNLTSGESVTAMDNLESLFSLDFHPKLTNFWITQSKKKNLKAQPPFGAIFAYRSEAKNFETFMNWFPFSYVLRGIPLSTESPPEVRSLTIAALDKGIIEIASSNRHVHRRIPIAMEDAYRRSFDAIVAGKKEYIDPAKALLFFLESIWVSVLEHRLHPGFDIRSYMSYAMDVFLDMGSVDNTD
ncbi:MAG TPA: hypothetical protein ENF45_01175 [Bacteroidetes bacterium]|nr:hypothetical protein [Bacteroidota bacterium]